MFWPYKCHMESFDTEVTPMLRKCFFIFYQTICKSVFLTMPSHGIWKRAIEQIVIFGGELLDDLC